MARMDGVARERELDRMKGKSRPRMMGDAMKGGLGERFRGTIFDLHRSGVWGQDMVMTSPEATREAARIRMLVRV